jgi:hypothetical protein
MRIKRLLTTALIATYISALTWGVGAHVMKFGLQGNSFSYFFVWDMFCGWQAYDNRTPIIAEGESGQFYDVRGPWGEFTPFGSVARIHYDVTNQLTGNHVRNVLAHTAHEPITNVFVIQEVWPKQFNMPAHLWAQYFEEPQDKTKYYHLRAILNDLGTAQRTYPDWYENQTLLSVADNPRLQRAAQSAQPFYNTFVRPTAGRKTSNSTFQTADSVPVGLDQFNTN